MYKGEGLFFGIIHNIYFNQVDIDCIFYFLFNKQDNKFEYKEKKLGTSCIFTEILVIHNRIVSKTAHYQSGDFPTPWS